MDINTHIELCHKRLSQIWKLVKDLERDQVPSDAPAYEILSEKAEIWINRLEAIAQADPGNGFFPEADDIIWN